MHVLVNGERRELATGATLADLLAELGVDGLGIAVALNDRVVRHNEFGDSSLTSGDRIEIIRAVAGG